MVTTGQPQTPAQVMDDMDRFMHDLRRFLTSVNREQLNAEEIGRANAALRMRNRGEMCWQAMKDQIAKRRQVDRQKAQKTKKQSKVVGGTLTPPPKDA